MQPSAESNEYWAIGADAVLKRLGVSRLGLSQAEAERRLAVHGPNRLPIGRRRSALTRFALQFHNVLIYVLLASAVVTALMRHWIDTAVIVAVVVINAIIGFIQEGKAERAMEAVRNMLSSQATVVRDGQRVVIDASGVAPGDIVYVQSGDRIPADIRLIRVKSLKVQESALTGESLPVDKDTAPAPGDAALGDRASMAYSGTVVTYGQGSGVVVATGAATEIGRINALLSEVETLSTPLLQRMDEFARWLTVVILAVCAAVFAFGALVWNFDAGEMFMAAVGLAVSAIPEGLPAIITITLAIGVERMARRKAIIRQLPAVETLGALSTICSDKTGTLTLNELIVRSIVTSGGVYDTTGAGYDPHGGLLREGKDAVVREDVHLAAALRPVALCNDAALREKDGIWLVEGDPTEGALLAVAVKGGVNLKELALELPRTDEIPFESQHKFMATLHHDHDGVGYIFVKGAPERLLEMCFWEQGLRGELRPLDCACWHKRIVEMAKRGQRVLAVASKQAEQGQQQLAFADVENGLVFVGIIGLIDPPRPEAIDAIRQCATAGMSVKMITGDHAATAVAIARELGLQRPDSVLTGRELDAIGDDDLGEAAIATTVFARTSPEHKLRLVQALQKRGEIVAMTGDGVNDAPALKRADIGIAMGVKGTEAAKEAAEMVLADDNFASIVHAVHEGRVVYENLKKTVLYILPTNGGEGLTIIAAIAMGETLPVTPAQILWVNLITAVTLGLALAFEPPTKGVMLRPPRASSEPILSRYFVWRIVFVSLLMLLATFGLYELEKARGMGLDSARTVAVNTLVACEVAYLFNARFLSESSLSPMGLFGSRAVLISVAIVIALQAMFTYLPFMQTLFNTTPLDPEIWLHIAGASVVLFLLVEIEKAIFRSAASAPAPRGAPAPQVSGMATVIAPGDWVRPVVAGLLGLLLVVATGAFYLHTRASLTREEAPTARAPTARTIVVSGVIAPFSETLIAAPAAGVIATLPCNIGAKVEKGETCATIDRHGFDDALGREKRALAAAERKLAQRQNAQTRAQSRLEKLETGSGRRAASRKALASGRRAVTHLQAQIERAEAEVALRRQALAAAEAARAGAQVQAPVAGFIVRQTASVGARVEVGAPLFVVANAETVRLHAKVAEEEALAITPGAKALLSGSSAPDRTFAGMVIEVRRHGSPQDGATADIVIEAENPGFALQPGTQASARIEIEEREAQLR